MSNNELNQKVFKWARSKLGQKIGIGECWDLAQGALKHAGAKASTPSGRDEDYVWGAPVRVQMVVPGDILQFRNHLVTKTVHTDITFDDGSGSEDTTIDPLGRPHHTAIVAENKGAFGLVIFEQNIRPGGRKVQRNTLLLAGSAPSAETQFRNVKDANGKMRRAKVVVTTAVTVTGEVWAYRPVAKP